MIEPVKTVVEKVEMRVGWKVS
jgi:hypothetical protein